MTRTFAPLLSLALLGGAAAGCVGQGTASAEASETGDESSEPLRPNWHQDIAPLVHAHCVECHAEGGVAPFALDDYASAADWADLLAEAVSEGTMPPWGAHATDECQPLHGWANDRRLSAAEIVALAEWAALDAPEGDPADAAELPEPLDHSLEGPSAIFKNPAPITLEPQADSFECVSIGAGLAEPVWITGVELLPDNEEVVHHVLIMLDETGASAELAGPDGRYPCNDLHLGTMLGSYFPGSVPTEMPENVGVPFPVGARIVLNYHYHPSGAGLEVDQSSVAVRWTSEPPAYEALISTVGNAETAAAGLLPGPNDPADGVPIFEVPANASGHTETMQVVVPEWLPEVELFMLGPHMHNVGTDIRVTHSRAGESRCLIHDPRWDPDWQSVYRVDAEIGEFPTLVGGDVITIRCTYDNTLDNPEVAEALASYGLDSPIDVYMGSAGLDEMCMFVYGIAAPREP